MKQADQIRNYVAKTIFASARSKGLKTIRVRAGDVHQALRLSHAHAAVCSALEGRKLLEETRVTLAKREGPARGSNVYFHYDLSGLTEARRPLISVATPAVQKQTSSLKDTIDWRDSLVIVSCTKAKTAHATSARDLYASPAFKMKRRLIERSGADWKILSAKHGLLDPSDVIVPYDETLTIMGVAARRQWAAKVSTKLSPLAKGYRDVVLLAGEKYAEHLIRPLEEAGVRVHRPLAGLRQGEQLQWLAVRQ